jgi:hypothetical protein
MLGFPTSNYGPSPLFTLLVASFHKEDLILAGWVERGQVCGTKYELGVVGQFVADCAQLVNSFLTPLESVHTFRSTLDHRALFFGDYT